MKKTIENPIVNVVRYEARDIITTSGKTHHGWGPDKNSDADGHDFPPGQRKNVDPFTYAW